MSFGEVPQLGLGLNRSRTDFSEEERSLLDLLKPHLTQALRASKLFSYYSDAVDAVTQGYLVADAGGKILFCTDKGLRWLEEYFIEGQCGLLPNALRDWLKNRSLQLSNSNDLSTPLRVFSIQRGLKRLIVEPFLRFRRPNTNSY